jgi:hypothetical protein
MSTITDLERLKKAVEHRAPRWKPTLVVLTSAEKMAADRFYSTPIFKGVFSDREWDKNHAFSAAFETTRVEHIPSTILPGYLFSGIIRSFQYFRAIFGQFHGHHHQAQFQPEDTVRRGLYGFSELRNQFERILTETLHNLERLKQSLSSEQNKLPDEHVRNALATMLLSPVLYPPNIRPDAHEVSLFMEWHMWQFLLPVFPEYLEQDRLRKRLYQSTIVDLNPMFGRLKELAYRAAGGITIPPALRNLDKFRADLEEGRINRHGVPGAGRLNLDLAVRFPEVVKTWVASSAERTRSIVRNARLYINWADAGL